MERIVLYKPKAIMHNFSNQWLISFGLITVNDVEFGFSTSTM